MLELLTKKTPTEILTIKTFEIEKLPLAEVYQRGDLTIEVLGVTKTVSGLDVLARAWNKQGQVGFGDGTVDIERFRFYLGDSGKNRELSWLVVPDPLGPIVIEETQTDIDGNPVTVTTRYREDPKEHLLMMLEKVIRGIPTKGSQDIRVGKVGNTVSTFNPNTTGSGRIQLSNTNWTTVRSATTASSTETTETEAWIFAGDFASPDYIISWQSLPFDTSAIPDTDTISSATLLIRQIGSAGEGNRSIGLIQSTQASPTAVATTDYDERGGLSSVSEGATRVTMNTINTDWTFTLNATGLGWISKTGYTQLGLRGGYDIDNTTPVARNYTKVATVDNATSAYRPLLSVTHSSTSGPANLKSLDTNVKSNIKSYNTNVLANIKSINTNA